MKDKIKNKINSPLELFQKLQDSSVEVYRLYQRICIHSGRMIIFPNGIEFTYMPSEFREDNEYFTWQPKQKNSIEYEEEIADLKRSNDILRDKLIIEGIFAKLEAKEKRLTFYTDVHPSNFDKIDSMIMYTSPRRDLINKVEVVCEK